MISAAAAQPSSTSCDANSACSSARCNAPSEDCMPKPSGGGPVGASCQVSSDCLSRVCHPATHLCMVSAAAGKPPSTSCNINSDCDSRDVQCRQPSVRGDSPAGGSQPEQVGPRPQFPQYINKPTIRGASGALQCRSLVPDVESFPTCCACARKRRRCRYSSDRFNDIAASYRIRSVLWSAKPYNRARLRHCLVAYRMAASHSRCEQSHAGWKSRKPVALGSVG